LRKALFKKEINDENFNVDCRNYFSDWVVGRDRNFRFNILISLTFENLPVRGSVVKIYPIALPRLLPLIERETTMRRQQLFQTFLTAPHRRNANAPSSHASA